MCVSRDVGHIPCSVDSTLEDEVGESEWSSSLYDRARSSELGKDLKGSSLGSWAVSSALQESWMEGRGEEGEQGRRRGGGR